MDALSLYLPTWSTDRVRRRLPPDSAGARAPILLSAVERQRTIVAACCALARAAGARPHMPLAQARALFATPPHIQPHAPADDLQDLQRLARWAYRFVPAVALDGDDGLLMDASGCAHLYGGIDRLIHRLRRQLRRAGFNPRIAAAPTLASARAIARFAHTHPAHTHHPTIITRHTLDHALDDLPIEALRLSPQSIDALHAVGIQTIAHARALPRSSLASRYDPEVLLRLDQALGNALDFLDPIRPTRPVRAERLFDGPTDRLDAIALAAQALVGDIAATLRSHQRGALWIRAELIRSDTHPLFIPVRTAEPCDDPAHLWKLLEPSLERAHLGFGVEGIRLAVLWSKRLAHAQATCWPIHQQQPPQVARLIDTLHARLGSQRIVRPVARESHLPENAFAFAPAIQRHNTASPHTPPHDCDRPTIVLDSPLPIDVTLMAPDGPLVTLRSRGESSVVRTCIGPERLACEWWKDQRDTAAARDYFKVQTNEGRWLWIYRSTLDNGPAARPPRWFLHGEWA